MVFRLNALTVNLRHLRQVSTISEGGMWSLNLPRRQIKHHIDHVLDLLLKEESHDNCRVLFLAWLCWNNEVYHYALYQGFCHSFPLFRHVVRLFNNNIVIFITLSYVS